MATSVNDLVTCNLQCPICLNVFVDPRLLSCSHTYCKDCLMRLFNSQKGCKITCPVCRKVTNVPKGNVDLLQCNHPIKSLIEDVKNQTQVCTVCRGSEKPLAITYCQECDDYMCVDCHKTHDKWDKFAGHEVVKVDDINSGKVSKKRRRKCQKHKSEDEEYFCVECKKFVCFRCGMMEHSQAGHKVLDGKAREDEQKEKIGELRSRADVKMSNNDAYIVFIEEQEAKMKQVLEKLSREIEQTCEESIQQLQERRDHLIKECTRRFKVFNKELQGMKDASKLQNSEIKEVSELVENGLKMPREGEALTAHDTLCQKLKEVLGKTDPDYEQPRKMTLQGESIAFQQTRRVNLNLGEIVILSPDKCTGGISNSVTQPPPPPPPSRGPPPKPSSSRGIPPPPGRRPLQLGRDFVPPPPPSSRGFVPRRLSSPSGPPPPPSSSRLQPPPPPRRV
ncbi:E3 ubiquitin-protein ligase TRIM56-like [Diadema antillarum]|uniref:E3 ubiquitin-protein ligase TRIM56-like n=1 Tax=Diadema antillarum TaxID=105358 RepID=UPI003A87A861